MIQRVRTVLLLGLPLFFSLSSDTAAQVGRLFGTVAYATPVQPTPARGVRVVAVNNYGQWETRTDNDGNFMMTLRAGSYRMLAQGAPGYVTYGDVWGHVRANSDSYITPNPLFLVIPRQSTNMSIGPMSGQTTAGLEHILKVQQSNITLGLATQNRSYGRLHGSIKYKDTNKPARDAKDVKVVAVDAQGQWWETKTDNYGNFELDLPAGDYKIGSRVANSTRAGVFRVA